MAYAAVGLHVFPHNKTAPRTIVRVTPLLQVLLLDVPLLRLARNLARIHPSATTAPATLVELLQPVHELGVRMAPHGLFGVL